MTTETFDYVIVGAGTAGSILAARLTEDASTTVCALESGPPDRHPWLHLPAGFIKVLFDPALTWQFSAEPTPNTNGRRIPLPQGRTLGGSSSINGLVYNRGQPEDYDRWAALGNPGWSYADLLPYFRRNERRIGFGDDAVRGRDGPVPVTDIDWIHPLCEAFIAGAQQLGIPRNPDYNSGRQAGVGYFQRTIHRGRRMSTAVTYLQPAKRRGNLSLRTGCPVTRLLFEGNRAVGIAYRAADGSAHEVRARRTVLLTAGAINTPKLLQLSGIGAPSVLQSAGVAVRHDLPGVGENLRDHFSVRVVARVRNVATLNEITRGPRLLGQVLRWAAGRPSALALSPSLVHFFWQSRDGVDRPDLQGVFAPASYREGYVGMLDRYPGMTAGVWPHRPQSAGHVRIQSSDPDALPLVQPNYLEHPEDRRVIVDGVRLARRLLAAPALAPWFERETLPGPGVQRDDELLDFVRRYAVSSYHLCGTARMGPASDRGTVVDPTLRVHGIDGLRIADSSIIPAIPSANICAATMMIAEKAADMLRSER